MYNPKENTAYELLIANAYREQIGTLHSDSEAFVLNAVIYYQIPKSLSKKKRVGYERNLVPVLVKPDIDNVIKSILDGLNGVAFVDDKQVIGLNVWKQWSDEPRIECDLRIAK